MFLFPVKTQRNVNCEIKQIIKICLGECDEIREVYCCSLIFDIFLCIIQKAASLF